MTELMPIPVNMLHDEFVALLEDILHRVRTGDSLEGNIQWLLPFRETQEEEDQVPNNSFDVIGGYRIGNRMGQGGFRTINAGMKEVTRNVLRSDNE